MVPLLVAHASRVKTFRNSLKDGMPRDRNAGRRGTAVVRHCCKDFHPAFVLRGYLAHCVVLALLGEQEGIIEIKHDGLDERHRPAAVYLIFLLTQSGIYR